MRMFVVGSMVALLVSSSVHATGPLTVGQLMVRCGQLDMSESNQVKLRSGSVGAALDAGKCWGHLEAYLDLATIELPGPRAHALGACPPRDQLNFTQMIQMFLQHARANPAELEKPAALIVANLLAQKFPCRG